MHFQQRSAAVIITASSICPQLLCPAAFAQASSINGPESDQSGATVHSDSNGAASIKADISPKVTGPGSVNRKTRQRAIGTEDGERPQPSTDGSADSVKLPQNSPEIDSRPVNFPGATQQASTVKNEAVTHCNLPANVRSKVKHCNDVGDFGRPNYLRTPLMQNPWRSPATETIRLQPKYLRQPE